MCHIFLNVIKCFFTAIINNVNRFTNIIFIQVAFSRIIIFKTYFVNYPEFLNIVNVIMCYFEMEKFEYFLAYFSCYWKLEVFYVAWIMNRVLK